MRDSRHRGLRAALGLGAATAITLILSACDSGSTTSPATTATSSVASTACQSGTLSLSGSTALQPLAQKVATEYETRCPGANITVSGGGSSAGLSNVAAGTSDIGDSDVPVSNAKAIDPTSVSDHEVAIVVFAVVVNPGAGVTNLTSQQVRDIFSGTVTNWSQVGGKNVPVTLIERKPGSGTRLSFDKDMMNGTAESSTPANTQDSTQLVVSDVGGATGGVSYVGVSSATSMAVPVSLDGVAASASTVSAGTYPFFSHEHMYTKGAGSALAQSFLATMLSDAVQNGDVTALHYLPLSTTSRQAAADH